MKKIAFQILGSSSSGNCSVLRTPNCTVLIDAGFTGKKISQNLAELGLRLSDIDAVFFTHEHNDHCAGICALSHESGIRFFANRGTAEAINYRFRRKFDWNIFETGTHFEFADLRVAPFAIPHDSAEPVGYVFECGETAGTAERVAWLTDCGKITGIVRRALTELDALVLEANYDDEMLSNSGRPLPLIQRIRSSHGHLSNDAMSEFLREYENPRLQRLLLAHVSRECNAETLVRTASAGALGARSGIASFVNPFEFLPAGAGWNF